MKPWPVTHGKCLWLARVQSGLFGPGGHGSVVVLVQGTISFSLIYSVAEEPSSPQRGKSLPLSSAKASYYITQSTSWVGCPFARPSDHLDATPFLLFVTLNSPT